MINIFMIKGSMTDTIDGGKWELVRRIQPGDSWHPCKDWLRGTEVYGTPGTQTVISCISKYFCF